MMSLTWSTWDPIHVPTHPHPQAGGGRGGFWLSPVFKYWGLSDISHINHHRKQKKILPSVYIHGWLDNTLMYCLLLKKKRRFLFLIMCVNVCLWAYTYECRCPWKTVKAWDTLKQKLQVVSYPIQMLGPDLGSSSRSVLFC